jgi:5-methylcytosine-specific restriction endonuclease McrA
MFLIKIQTLHGFSFNKKEHVYISTYNPHPQSQASLILLKKQYEQLIPRLTQTNPDWRIWLTFRNRYLKRVMKLKKTLTCEYCGLTDLHPNSNSPYAIGKMATIDHIIPTSKGGKKYDESNFTVACFTCNNKKADKIL